MELADLGRELRYTQQVVASELASWQENRVEMGRRALKELARRMVVTEKARLEGMRRAVRGLGILEREKHRTDGEVVMNGVAVDLEVAPEEIERGRIEDVTDEVDIEHAKSFTPETQEGEEMVRSNGELVADEPPPADEVELGLENAQEAQPVDSGADVTQHLDEQSRAQADANGPGAPPPAA
jgi:hypothetical protein